MARPAISSTNINPLVDKNFSAIREVLTGGVDLDNLHIQTLSGTTADTADTQKRFNHSMSPPPGSWIPLVGDVYVQEISDKYIDIRSTKPGVNFKVILIAGSLGTNSAGVVSTGNENYKTTEQIIQATPTVVETVTVIQPFTAGNLNTSSLDAFYYRIVNDASYFYVTFGGASVTGSKIARINKITKEISTLTLGTNHLTALWLDEATFKLYVIDSPNASSSVKVYVINTIDFTLSATITITGVGSQFWVSDLIVDGQYVWWSSSSTNTGASAAQLNRGPIGGGAGSVVVTAGGSTAARIKDDGTFIWTVATRTAGANNFTITKVNKSSLAVTQYEIANTFNIPTRGKMRSFVLVDTTLIIPFLARSPLGAVGDYTSGVVLFDTQLGEVIQTIPIPAANMSTEDNGGSFISDIVEFDGFVYGIIGTSSGNAIILRGDTLFGDITFGVTNFPLGVIRYPQHSGSPYSPEYVLPMDTSLQIDKQTGEIFVIGNPKTSSARNFEGISITFADNN